MTLAGRGNRRHVALLLLSTALLSFQIVLLQVLATSQWHHFAYFVISCSLLGFGAAGTTLTLLRKRLLKKHESLLPVLHSLTAVTLAGSLALTGTLCGGFDSMLLFVDQKEIVRFTVAVLLLMLPFYCGALAIGLIFAAETERIGGYYFANMLGSGLGSLLALFGLDLFLPQQLLPVCALLALAAAAVLWSDAHRLGRLAILCSLVLVTALQFFPASLPLSQFKDLNRTLDLPQARIIAHLPSAAGQIHLVSSPVLRSAPGLSLEWTGHLPASPAVFINGDLLGSLPAPPGTDNPRSASTHSLPYALLTPTKVLVLDAGTGADVALALARDADEVVAVDAHGELVRSLARSAPRRLFPWLADRRVAWHAVAPRTWLASDRQSYDLIVLPDVGGFGGNAGLSALSEQPLLTREAFLATWDRLSPDGLLSVTAWVDYPVRSPVRLLATLAEVLREAGIVNPSQHIAAVRSWGTITFCLKRAPLTTIDLRLVRAFAERWAFDPALLPDLRPAERQLRSRLGDDNLFLLLDTALGENRSELYRNYPFRIWPADDDRPFFAQFLRWDRLPDLAALYGQHGLPFLELGLLVAGVAALVLSILAALLILLPLAGLPNKGRHGLQPLIYFGGLGLGYMWVELAMIHRFVFYLGQPVAATAIVVGVLLVGSAVGSLVTERFTRLHPWRWAALVAAILGFYTLILPPLLEALLLLPFAGRAALAILILLPVAVIMGMPFPLGMRLLHRHDPEGVPWAWGINGCCSVVGASIASLIAVELGYSLLLTLAAGAYLAVVVARLEKTRPAAPC